MSSIFFFYTLAFITLCLVTGVISAMAFTTSRRRIYLFGCILFFAYAAEMSEIFFYEYSWQNMAFPAAGYYEVSNPLIRTAIATAAQTGVWLMVIELLGEFKAMRSPRAWAPGFMFFMMSLFVITVVHEGPWQQWCYYLLRTLFLAFSLGYLHFKAKRLPTGSKRDALIEKQGNFFLLCALVAAVALEDTLVILVIPATGALQDLYVSERNFSENALAVYFAWILLKNAWHVLTVRIGEGPKTSNADDLEQAIEDQMAYFQKEHGLSKRECEILSMVLEGKTNQQIADELYLALGTVKTHVHNIMKKSGQASREALATNFWKRG